MVRFLLSVPCMTQPRLVLPGDTVMVTRRTLRRHHLFRPDPAIRRLYLYTLGVCAARFGVLVVALGTKVLRKWEGPAWDHEQASVVRLLTEQAVVEKLAYVMANPVKAGLVHRARKWPGITVLPQELGRRTWRIERPDVYFDPDNPEWPDTAELSLTMPSGLQARFADDEVRNAVAQELRRQEELAHREVKARNWAVLGAERVRRLSPYRRAKSFEPLRSRNPTFAVGRGQKKVFFRVVAELRAFRRAYRQALEQWRAGVRDALFPPGTWGMCQMHGALVST